MKVILERNSPTLISVIALIFPVLLFVPRADAQSLTMDGESGIFLQPVAEVVPSPQNKFGGPTLSLHAVGAGPVAGNYINL
jgi:hypothetical protein